MDAKRALTDKCIVLDLDQTLVATQDDMEQLYELNILKDPQLLHLRNRTYVLCVEDLEKPGCGTAYNYWGIIRPHTKDFLRFCFDYFNIVAVWSAGQRPYVEQIVDHLFKDMQKPHIIFTHEDVERDDNGDVVKPLLKLFEAEEFLSNNMFLENTVILDDNAKTFSYNHKNGIHIPEYRPKCTLAGIERDDIELLKFKNWLLRKNVIQGTDVTALDKSIIF